MARRRGQVDERKSEAILDAAATLFADKGLQAKMDEIAKLAGVSKQTVYNRFASKLEIAQALALTQRVKAQAHVFTEHAALVVFDRARGLGDVAVEELSERPLADEADAGRVLLLRGRQAGGDFQFTGATFFDNPNTALLKLRRTDHGWNDPRNRRRHVFCLQQCSVQATT